MIQAQQIDTGRWTLVEEDEPLVTLPANLTNEDVCSLLALITSRERLAADAAKASATEAVKAAYESRIKQIMSHISNLENHNAYLAAALEESIEGSS